MKTILVTGGAGFIGSNFIPYYLNAHDDVRIVNLDKLTYASDLANLREVENHPRYKFVQGDICNRELVEYIFREFGVSGVVHFAAESHVDNSITDPDIFVKTNVTGTFTLLDVARRFWMAEPFRYHDAWRGARFHHISTDEVYGSLGETGYFTEETPYAPNSPYSASKAASDMFVRAYHHTYGLDVTTTNCSNNYGPKQHKEKLIPTIIRKALAGEPIPIYGKGTNVRDWLYVEDHCRAIDLVFNRGVSGETYNIGGGCEKKNIDISLEICSILDSIKLPNISYKEHISFVSDRPGHDFRYSVDFSKIFNSLSWKPSTSFQFGIRKTISWYEK